MMILIPQKTHNLLLLNDKCIEIDDGFNEIKMECGFINRYASEIRYPYRIKIHEEDVVYIIRAIEKIKNMDALKIIRDEIIKTDNRNNVG
jgi:hypothetical protein